LWGTQENLQSSPCSVVARRPLRPLREPPSHKTLQLWSLNCWPKVATFHSKSADRATVECARSQLQCCLSAHLCRGATMADMAMNPVAGVPELQAMCVTKIHRALLAWPFLQSVCAVLCMYMALVRHAVVAPRACAHFIFILRSRHAIVCSVHAWHYPLCHARDTQLMPWSDSTSVVCAQSCLPCWATHPYCFFLSELEPHTQCMLRTGGHACAEHGSLQWASGLRSCSAS
jgi:hypothetical protein